MLRDKEGNRLFRKVQVKVVFPDQIFPDRTFVQRSGPKQGFGPEGVDGILNQVADQLDTLYPFWNFEPVELTPEHRTARFLFKFAGYNNTTPTESTTPELETAEDGKNELLSVTPLSQAAGLEDFNV